ncbi:18876_t:CDS:1, partial [Racocetra persica]
TSKAITPPFIKENDELAGSFGEGIPQLTFSPPKPSQHHTSFSRYKLDFEEIEFLGK